MANKHTTHHIHAMRILLLGVLLIAVSIVRIDANALPSLTKPTVLAYATSMSRGDLFAAANASRSANGLAPFTLNGQLNNSAQAKAQHMADNNYWAHVAPDGTQPWYFFEASGYNYVRAGENLAYGFGTSYDTNQGWMNSPSHRANVLGDYVDVGFGIVNSASFQGGENTIVVAHYGTQASYTPPAPAPAPTPAPTPTPAPSVQQSTTASPSTPTAQSPATEAPAPTPTESAPTENKEQTTPVKEDTALPPTAPIATGTTKNVSVLESLKNGALPNVAAISLGITLATALGYALSHRALMKHAFATSEQYVMAHPTFDAIALFVALSLILSTTVAHLQ